MKEPVWLLPEVVISVHQMLLAEYGEVSGIHDEPLLDSALNRSRQLFAYGDKPSICEIASSYCFGLAKNHPFIDGNKRVALTIAALFLARKSYDFA